MSPEQNNVFAVGKVLEPPIALDRTPEEVVCPQDANHSFSFLLATGESFLSAPLLPPSSFFSLSFLICAINYGAC